MKVIVAVVMAAVMAVVFGALFAIPVMLLWDALIPSLFGLGTITWLQAWGLLILCGLLFKNTNSSQS